MTLQSRAFGYSLAVHAIMCCCILAAGAIVPKTRTVVLDFSLGQSSLLPGTPPVKTVTAKHRRSANQENKTVTPTVKEAQATPLAQEKTMDNIPGQVSENIVHTEQRSENASDGPISSQGTADEEKAIYISAHFLHIRSRIIKNLVYPQIARNNGWSGKVTVAFTVCADGSVEEVTIMESSGFPVLDKSALETIKKSCPLPKPPAKTALIMPILYRLE